MEDQSSHRSGRRTRRFGRRHRHRDNIPEEYPSTVIISNSGPIPTDLSSGPISIGFEERRHRHHRHHSRRHPRHPGLGRLFAQHARSVVRNSFHNLYDGILNQFPQEMSAQYQDLLNRSQSDHVEAGQEMHEFIGDPRGPPPPYNPYAPPPRATSSSVSEFLQDPLNSSLQTFSKVTQMVQNRTPILNMGIAGAQALHHALTTRPPGTAERIYPELPTNPDHSGPHSEPPAPPPPLPIISNTIQSNRLEPLTKEEFQSKNWTLDELKIRVFKGGIAEDNEFRAQVWTFILDITDSEPETEITSLNYDWSEEDKLFGHYENQWQSILPEQEKRFSLYRERKSLIERDVIRCDRTHPYYRGDNNDNLDKLKMLLMNYMMYDFDTGYVQGMTDLASPLIYMTDGDIKKSFWFFTSIMDFTHYNFEMSQNTIKLQLDMLWKMIQFTDPDFAEYLAKNDSVNCYFAFRWIVCQFKREFMKDNDGYNDIVVLWESIWTCSAMKRHLIKLRNEKKESDKKNDEDINKKIQSLSMEQEMDDELESPLIDLNSVSMKALQDKQTKQNLEGSDSGEQATTSNQQAAATSSSSTSLASSSSCSKKNPQATANVNKSKSETLLNYYVQQPKRLSDTELYVLCICLCIIRRERDLIMAKRYDATDILKHFNTLELNGDLRDILIHAANIWSWMIYDEKEELLYAELQQSSSSDSNLAHSPSNLNADDEYDLLPDVLVSGEDGFLN